MRILVRVCTRLGSDVISISITGGALSRGVCLSKLLPNITSPSRRNKSSNVNLPRKLYNSIVISIVYNLCAIFG